MKYGDVYKDSRDDEIVMIICSDDDLDGYMVLVLSKSNWLGSDSTVGKVIDRGWSSVWEPVR